MSLSLLPGFGDKYQTTLTLHEAGAASYTDPLDVTPCAQIAIQITEFDGDGVLTAQTEHSLDGQNWAVLGGPTTVENGSILNFSIDDQLIGVIRVGLTEAAGSDSVSSDVHTAIVTIVGSKVQVMV